MSRLIVIAVVVLVVVGGLWLGASAVTKDRGVQIGLAFGYPDEGVIEMQAVVSMKMPDTEGPRIDLPQGGANNLLAGSPRFLWQEWVDDHFILQDGDGNTVKLGLRQSTDLIPRQKVPGTPHGYLLGKLQAGVKYTFDYKPKRAEEKRYRHVFVAPEDETPFRRPLFTPVK